MTLAMRVKRLVNMFGYDIKYYRPFNERVLLPFNFQAVIDIGANEGRFSEEMRILFPTAEIYAFEPLSSCVSRIQKRMAGDARFTLFPVALGEEKGSLPIRHSSFHPSSSLLPMAALHEWLYPKSKEFTLEPVPVEQLDSILTEKALTGPVLVKIDVQGYEDRVIAGGTATLAKADLIIIETSFVTLYEGQPLFGDIYDALRALGFSYTGNREQHFDPKTQRLIYEDSLFERSSK